MEKQAALNPADAQLSTLHTGQINSNYLDLLKNVVLGTVAAGGAIRGGQGLLNMVRRNRAPQRKPTPLSFAVPPEAASGGAVPLADPVAGPLAYGKAAGMGQAAWDMAMTPVNSVGDWLQSKNITQMSQKPEFWGGLGMAGAGGLYAGYQGVDAVMQSRRKAELESEENAARQEYEKSLAGISSKGASLEEGLSKLYESKDEILKQADMPDLKQLGSAALGAWPPLAALSGVVAYNITNSRRRSKLLESALKKRQRSQLADAPVFAYTPEAAAQPSGMESPTNEFSPPPIA